MKSRTLLVSGAVAAICAAILVLFTDIELSLFHWVNCGPLAVTSARKDLDCAKP